MGAAQNVTATGQALIKTQLMTTIGNVIAKSCRLWFAAIEEGRATVDHKSGGRSVEFDFMHSLGSTKSVWQDSGTPDAFATPTPNNTLGKGVVYYRELRSECTVTWLDDVLGNTDEAIVTAKGYEVERAVRAHTAKLGDALWRGGYESDADAANRLSMPGLLYWLAPVAHIGTIGGVVRGTYTTFVANIPASTVTQVTLNLVEEQLDNCSAYATGDYAIFGTPKQVQKLKAEGREYVRVVGNPLGKKYLDLKIPAIEIGGAPVIPDPSAPTDLSAAVASGGIALTSGAQPLVGIHIPTLQIKIPPKLAGESQGGLDMAKPKFNAQTGFTSWRGSQFRPFRDLPGYPLEVGYLYQVITTVYEAPPSAFAFLYLAG